MKKLSKIVALLLAGALTMLLFTACSGGGGGGDYGTRDAGKEASLFTSVKGSGQASAQVTANDPTLCETADRHLKEDLNSSVDFLGAKWVANVHVDGKEDQYLIITATATYIGGPLSELTLKKIEELAGKKLPGTDVNVRGNGSWIDVGVVVPVSYTHLTLPTNSRV